MDGNTLANFIRYLNELFEVSEVGWIFPLRVLIQIDNSDGAFDPQAIFAFGWWQCHYCVSNLWRSIKGEFRNRFNLISEEREKNRTKQWKLDEHQLKIKEVMTLKFRKFSRNISWPVDMIMNMQMNELIMSSPHNFPFILYREMKKKKKNYYYYFSYENVRLALIPLWIDAEYGELQYILIRGTYYHKFGQNIKIFKKMASSEAMTSSHSFVYSYRCLQKCFVKICETLS